MRILVKKPRVWSKINIMFKKLKFWSKIQILVKNPNFCGVEILGWDFGQNQDLDQKFEFSTKI